MLGQIFILISIIGSQKYEMCDPPFNNFIEIEIKILGPNHI